MGEEEKDQDATQEEESDSGSSPAASDDPDHKRSTDPNVVENDSGNKCPECDAPIDNVRVTCPNCGYEYQEGDYDDKEAGNEFRAGSALDDKGNEQTDDPSGN